MMNTNSSPVKKMANKKANTDIKLANLMFNPLMLRKGLLTFRAINHPVRKELIKIIFKQKAYITVREIITKLLMFMFLFAEQKFIYSTKPLLIPAALPGKLIKACLRKPVLI